MDLNIILGIDIFNWVLMPFMIFVARVFDVSFGTLRVIFISQGFKKIATIVGFFEVLIWILVARQVITNLENFIWIIAYAAGYATGTYVGIVMCEKLSIGKVVIRVIIKHKAQDIIDELRLNNFGVTVIDAQGAKSKSYLIFSVVDLKDVGDALKIIKTHNPKAFYSIESIKDVREGNFRKHAAPFKIRTFMPDIYSLKKSK